MRSCRWRSRRPVAVDGWVGWVGLVTVSGLGMKKAEKQSPPPSRRSSSVCVAELLLQGDDATKTGHTHGQTGMQRLTGRRRLAPSRRPSTRRACACTQHGAEGPISPTDRSVRGGATDQGFRSTGAPEVKPRDGWDGRLLARSGRRSGLYCGCRQGQISPLGRGGSIESEHRVRKGVFTSTWAAARSSSEPSHPK